MDSQAKAKVALTFALYQGDRLVRRDTIAQDIVKVGKDPRSHLRVDDELASRMHAVIEVASLQDITLIDLGNKPGTLVNGQRVNKCKLRPSDQIQIGSTLIVLESAEPATESPPVAAPTPAAVFAPVEAPVAAPRRSVPAARPIRSRLGAAAPPAAANPFAGANPFAAPAAAAATAFARRSLRRSGCAAEDGDRAGHRALDGQGRRRVLLLDGQERPRRDPDEVEVAHLSAIEVMVLWDTNVLHVSHLRRRAPSTWAKSWAKRGSCDYFIPSETLGTTRAPVVVSRGLGASLVILPRSRGYVGSPGEGQGQPRGPRLLGPRAPSTEMSGAHEYELPPGAKARMELGGSALVFQVSAVNAGKRVAVGLLATSEPAAFLSTGLSFVLHMGLVAVFAFFLPGMRGDDSEAIDRDDLLMQK